MKKPTGKNGITRVTIKPEGKPKADFIAHEYPEKKDDIEEYVVKTFISSANSDLLKHGESFILSNPQKNELNDFDFTVNGPALSR
jgi:hypothetical protein